MRHLLGSNLVCFRPLPRRNDAAGDASGKPGVKPTTGNNCESSDDEIDEKTLLNASPSMKRLYYGTGSVHSSVSVPPPPRDESDGINFTAHADDCYCCGRGPFNSPFCVIVGETFDPTLFKN